jgi:hypothetical protein
MRLQSFYLYFRAIALPSTSPLWLASMGNLVTVFYGSRRFRLRECLKRLIYNPKACRGVAFGQESSVYFRVYLPNATPLQGTFATFQTPLIVEPPHPDAILNKRNF